MVHNNFPAVGMRDLLPEQVQLRKYVIDNILNIYEEFGFTQIDTPSIEKIKLLSSGEGGDNEKMIFKILKRGEKLDFSSVADEAAIVDLGLRYDLTVPLSRFYANNRPKLASNFKSIQLGNVWRAERPQKGRFRQFTQCDIDIIGTKSVIAEIELIIATAKVLQKLNFRGFTVRINDRRVLESLVKHCEFEQTAFSKVFIILDKLDKIGIAGVRNELEKSDFQPDSIDRFISLITLATQTNLTPKNIIDFLPDIPKPVLADLEKVIDTVKRQANDQYSIKLDLSLVRGMGYYTGQIFEIQINGYKSSVAGGGRYDKMIGKILKGKEEIPACGFSIGFERVISILEEQNFIIPKTKHKIAILYKQDLSLFNSIIAEANRLREKGSWVSLEPQKKNTKKQLSELSNQGFNSFGIYSSDKTLSIKDLKE